MLPQGHTGSPSPLCFGFKYSVCARARTCACVRCTEGPPAVRTQPTGSEVQRKRGEGISSLPRGQPGGLSLPKRSGLLALGQLPCRDSSGVEQQEGFRTGPGLCLETAWPDDGWGRVRGEAQIWGVRLILFTSSTVNGASPSEGTRQRNSTLSSNFLLVQGSQQQGRHGGSYGISQ